jgi:hypothetical protein
MSASLIQQLAERLLSSDPANSQEQRDLFERIRELRSDLDGPLDPESQRRLEAASMLVAYLARMGALAGEEVRTIAVRLLRAAAEAEESASKPSTAPPSSGARARAVRPSVHKIPAKQPPSAPVPERTPMPRSATDLMGDMMLGQILLQRGHILEEHIQQAMKIQRSTPMRIGDVFVKIGACSRAQVADALAHQASLRRVRDNLGESAGKKLERPAMRGTGLKLVGEAMLGEILIERNVITRRQLERALDLQKQSGIRIGEALVKIGATTIDQIEQALLFQGRERRFGTKSGKDEGKQ